MTQTYTTFWTLQRKKSIFKNYRKYSKHTYRLAASPLWKLWDCLVFWLISIHTQEVCENLKLRFYVERSCFRRKWLGSSLYMRNTRKKKKQPLLVFKQPPFYHKWYFMTEPFRRTCQLKRKQLPWEYRQWKRVLILMWWSKPAVVFIVKRNAKSPCWYLRHQIRYISRI